MLKTDYCSDYWSCLEPGHPLRVWRDGLAESNYATYFWNSVEANIWYHLVVTYNGQQTKIYINNTLIAVGQTSSNFGITDKPLWI